MYMCVFARFVCYRHIQIHPQLTAAVMYGAVTTIKSSLNWLYLCYTHIHTHTYTLPWLSPFHQIAFCLATWFLYTKTLGGIC